MHNAVKWVLAAVFMLSAGGAVAQQTFTKTRIGGAGRSIRNQCHYRLMVAITGFGCGNLRSRSFRPNWHGTARPRHSSQHTLNQPAQYLVLGATVMPAATLRAHVNLRIIPGITVAAPYVIARRQPQWFICPPPGRTPDRGPRPPLPPDTAAAATPKRRLSASTRPHRSTPCASSVSILPRRWRWLLVRR